jgi:hypothetical protein
MNTQFFNLKGKSWITWINTTNQLLVFDQLENTF